MDAGGRGLALPGPVAPLEAPAIGPSPSPWWLLLQVLARRRGWILLAVAGALLGAVGYEWHRGLGRTYEATTRLGLGASPREWIVDLIHGQIVSGDMHRAVGLSPSATVTAQGAPVIVVSVTAPTAREAIAGANAIADRLLAEAASQDERMQGEARRRHAEGLREAERLEGRAAAVRAMLAEVWAGREASAGLAALVSVAEGLEERALTLRRLPPPTAATPGLALRRIDRAVSATRLPARIWWSLGSALTSSLVGTCLLIVVLRWAEDQRQRQAGA